MVTKEQIEHILDTHTNRYWVGKALEWMPYYAKCVSEREIVFVERVRRNGNAILSNGWEIDEFGTALGTNRMPGGHANDVLDQSSFEEDKPH